MEQNVGFADRYIRLTLAGLMLAGSAARMTRRVDGTAVALGLLGGMMLAEGTLGACPLYSAAGIRTNRAEDRFQHSVAEPPPGERTNDDILPYEGI